MSRLIEEILTLENVLFDVARLRASAADNPPHAAALDALHMRIDNVRRGLAAGLTVAEDCELERNRHAGNL